MTNINHIIMVVIVFIIIFWLFEQMNQKYYTPTNETFIAKNEYMPQLQDFIIPPTNRCPVRDTEVQTRRYINKYPLGNGGTGYCPRPVKTIKQFNKDFFKFRDYIENNSSMHVDTVDKIADMYLDGDLGHARNYPQNTTIKDVFDNLTCGPHLYDRSCVRMPRFDNTMNDGFNFSFLTGMYNTRDKWNYPHDNEMNTGKLEKTLSASDPEDIRQMPYYHVKSTKFGN
jgi:hypothetical protein